MENQNRTKFNTSAKPTWCPGCGNFGIQAALKKAFLELGLEPHQIVMSSGIGCSGKIPHWLNIYGLHGLHGRTLPAAAGIKLANHKLVVIAEGGDGDGYSEGLNHFIHACRRNVDLTYVVHNNGVFSLTKGQVSPSGARGFVGATTPGGSIEAPLNPLALALGAGATFVARGFSGNAEHLAMLVREGISHHGFAFIDVLQVCVTYNPARSYKWYQERVFRLEDSGHNPDDLSQALKVAFSGDEKLATGILFRTRADSAYEDHLPQLKEKPLVEQEIMGVDISRLMEELF